MKRNLLYATVRTAISNEWHRRIAEQIADNPDGHIDALADAVVAKLENKAPPCRLSRVIELFKSQGWTLDHGKWFCPKHGKAERIETPVQ